jgi:hypothetical protein
MLLLKQILVVKLAGNVLVPTLEAVTGWKTSDRVLVVWLPGWLACKLLQGSAVKTWPGRGVNLGSHCCLALVVVQEGHRNSKSIRQIV